MPSSQKEYQVYLPYEKLSYFKQHFKNALDTRPRFTTYKVKKGDNLSSIAKRHNVSVDKIKQLNGLKSNALMVNQTLKLPTLNAQQSIQKGSTTAANTKQITTKKTTRS